MIGLGIQPQALSNPFLLKITFIQVSDVKKTSFQNYKLNNFHKMVFTFSPKSDLPAHQPFMGCYGSLQVISGIEPSSIGTDETSMPPANAPWNDNGFNRDKRNVYCRFG